MHPPRSRAIPKLPASGEPGPAPRRAIAVSWLLALAVPALSALIWRLWLNASISARACASGAPGLNVGSVAIFVVLVAATPLVVWQYGRRSGSQQSTYVVVAFAVGTFVAFAALYLVTSHWWSAHGCAT